MSHAIRDRLMASVRIDAINGDGFERSVVRGQILEAISYIDAQAGQIATLKNIIRKERFFRVWANTKNGSASVNTVAKVADKQLAKEYPEIDWGGQP